MTKGVRGPGRGEEPQRREEEKIRPKTPPKSGPWERTAGLFQPPITPTRPAESLRGRVKSGVPPTKETRETFRSLQDQLEKDEVDFIANEKRITKKDTDRLEPLIARAANTILENPNMNLEFKSTVRSLCLFFGIHVDFKKDTLFSPEFRQAVYTALGTVGPEPRHAYGIEGPAYKPAEKSSLTTKEDRLITSFFNGDSSPLLDYLSDLEENYPSTSEKTAVHLRVLSEELLRTIKEAAGAKDSDKVRRFAAQAEGMAILADYQRGKEAPRTWDKLGR